MCLAEARPCVQIVFGLRYLCGFLLAAHEAGPLITFRGLASAVVWEFAVVFVYLLNGVTDVAGDKINGSRRPIARGHLEPKTAQRVAVGSAVAALSGGIALGGAFTWMVPTMVLLGFLYSGPPCYLKRRAACGLLTGSLGGLLTYGAGYAAGGGRLPAASPLIFATMMSAWMGVVGSVTKDLSDVAGDVAAGRRTAVIIYGEKKARLASSALALALGAAFLVTTAQTAPTLAWPAVAMQAGAVLVAASNLWQFRTGSRRHRPYRAFMLTQYMMHLSLLARVISYHALGIIRW
jgi:4-hydroxybenzoate polyprenyltransferase